MNIKLVQNLWRKGLMVLINFALLAGLVWSALPAVSVGAASTGYVQDVDAGGAHTCVLTSAGGVKCWGYNGSGQIGADTSGLDAYVPIDVTGLTSGVAAVVTGRNHSCALLDTGGVQCWGANSEGQLGNNSTTSSNVPVDVCANASCAANLSNVAAIAAGEYHTCAVLDSGGVRCWGDNTSGQLGNNSTTDSSTPVNVGGLTNVSAVTAGRFHTCAIVNGGVKCWGYNMEGQLGNGTAYFQSLTPVDVCTDASCTNLLSNVSAITAGLNHTCAIASGGAQCWGDNTYGQVGNTTFFLNPIPIAVYVDGLSNGVSDIDAGYQHTCAVTTSGAAKCWGYNASGQLGNNSTTDSDVPINVSELSSNVNTVTGGDNHSCALLSDGLVKCWGDNLYGQLGDGNATNDSDVPVNQLWLNTYAAPSVTQGMCGGNGPCFTSIQQAIDMASGYPYYAPVTIDVQTGTYTGSVDLNKIATLSFANGVTLNGGITQSGTSSVINAPAGTLYLTGDWTRSAGTFNHNNGTIVFSGSGVQTINGNATWFYNLTVNSSSTLVIPVAIPNRPTVDGTITNNGALRQTQTVSGFTDFLSLSNSDYSTQKHWGVWITPSSSMGDTMVTIRGNQNCTTNPADSVVKRCFEITPSTPVAAAISFFYTEAERNEQVNGSMLVYHWNTTNHVWDQEMGSYYRAGSGDEQVVYVTDVSNYSKFVLSSSLTAPNAVKLNALTGVGGGWGFSVLLGFVAAFALTRRKRQ